MKSSGFRIGLAGFLALGAPGAIAAASAADLGQCAAIRDNGERLSCYDRLAGRTVSPSPGKEGTALSSQPVPAPQELLAVTDKSGESSILSRHWELDQDDKRGVFRFRQHRNNYLIATYNPSPNEEPYRPYQFLIPEAEGLSPWELAFQMGFKLKLAENVADWPLDLWFAYTQNSYWQISNREASTPFRETNYQPEVMAVLPLNLDLLGMRLRFLNVGLSHQSNGQSATLSRSWDRVYLQAGLEREQFTLLARIWKRLSEDRSTDDNPDIIDYMGRGDLLATYYHNGHELSLLTRYNFRTGKGAAQLGWAFPLKSQLKGYVQYFSGYGYSLIDYNAVQRVLGVGFKVDF